MHLFRRSHEQGEGKKSVDSTADLQRRPAYNWRIIRPLKNNGGLNGGINLVESLENGKLYVEKVGERDLIEDGVVEQEIAILQFLSQKDGHPNITRMVDHYVDKRRNKASIYLEYCTKGGLDSFIKERRKEGEYFNELHVWEWFIELFGALSFVHHGNGPVKHPMNSQDEGWNMIWHRDIKPGNILVTEENTPGHPTKYIMKLADFGCAVERNHVVANRNKKFKRTSIRTVGWEPPEYPRFTGRSDIWQLGAIMGCICNLVIDPSTFDHQNPAPGYTETLNRAIASCMDPKPEKRAAADDVWKHVKDKYEKKKDWLREHPHPEPMVVQDVPSSGHRNAANAWPQAPQRDFGLVEFGQGPHGVDDFEGFDTYGMNEEPPVVPEFGAARGWEGGRMPRAHTDYGAMEGYDPYYDDPVSALQYQRLRLAREQFGGPFTDPRMDPRIYDPRALRGHKRRYRGW